MHVILRQGPDGREKDLELEGTDTIAEVRLKVAAVTGVHPEHQRLVLREGDVELCDDAETVAQHHIQKEAEIRLLPRPSPRAVSLNVGGFHHATLLSTLRRVEGSRLDKMFDGLIEHSAPAAEGVPHEVSSVFTRRQADGAYFIDRNGRLFEYVLDYLRDYHPDEEQAEPEPELEGDATEDVARAEISLPSSPDDLRQLTKDAGFYGLSGLSAACRQRLGLVEACQQRLAVVAATPGAVQIHDAELPHYLATNVTISFAETDVPYNDDVVNLCGWQLVAHAHAPSGDTRNELSWYTALHKPVTEFAGNYGETWRIESAGGGLFHIISTGRKNFGAKNPKTPGWALSCHGNPGIPSDARNCGSFTMVHDGPEHFSKWRIDDVGGGCVRIVLVWPGNKMDGWVLACHAHVPSGDKRSAASWKTMVHPSAADNPTPGSIWRISRAILR